MKICGYWVFQYECPTIKSYEREERDYMKEQKHSYSQRIGKTTFIVNVKQSESAKKPLNTVFQDICKHEVLGDFFTDKSFNLENPQKVS